MSLQYKAVLFDLDGTLLNSLEDLADATNAALTAFGLPVRTVDEVRQFVGNGVRLLMERAVPGGAQHPQFEEILAYFKEYYAAHCRVKTAPYPGILPLLDALAAAGAKTAVVSNKFDGAVKELALEYFGPRVALAVGEKPGVRKKPAPDAVLEALRQLEVAPGQAVYIGDSDVDVETARNAGLDGIGVSWGFRSRQVLEEAGAARIAADPAQLARMLGL